MLVLRISVEFGAVDTVGVAIVGSVSFFQLHHLLSLHFVVESNDWLAASGHQFGAVEGVIEAVELLVDRIRVIFQSGK